MQVQQPGPSKSVFHFPPVFAFLPSHVIILGSGPTWKLLELVPVILVLPWPAQPEGTSIFVRVAWLGDQFAKTVLAHIETLPDMIVMARNQRQGKQGK